MRRRFLALTLALCLAHLTAMAEDHQIPPNMAHYVVGLLKRGSSWTPERTPETAKIQEGHMAHLGKMAESGKLVGAGPFLDDGAVRGILIFSGISLDEARALAVEDPAVKAGRLELELHPWLGPKGIGARYAEMAKAGPVDKIPMVTLQFAFLTRGPAWTPDQTPETAKIQEGHMAHIGRMAESGKLVAAGPFMDGGQLRGVFVFRATPDEARALAAEDPAVKAGRLALELRPWMVADGVMP
jgi:uncharacterized protein YciI